MVSHVQYDGKGEWIDVRFEDGRTFRFLASFLQTVADEREALPASALFTRPRIVLEQFLKNGVNKL